ncbi:hypothetical protein [Sphingobacterium siyangense]|uniref:hypothetical protein n=1 Tax=Sphingobacterium siyangense TaxID=459529 RepID=UPI003DA37580
MEQIKEQKPAVETGKSKKETIATYTALIICLLPGFWIILFWYAIYEAYAKQYNSIVTAIAIFVLAYLLFVVAQAILKQIILFIIK